MSENNEEVPASGSAPSLNFEPKFMDSLDARIIQYKYALVKLERLIKAIDDVTSENSTSANNLVLIHYLIYIASNLFAINESGFFPKLQALENFKVPKSLSVTTSQVVTHIPYDMRDQAIVPLDDLPGRASSISCLKAFRALCLNCQEGYQKRFTNASREIENDKYLADLDELFTKVFFDIDKDFDMVLKSSLFQYSSLLFQVDPQMGTTGDYSEASLIDIDMYSLFTIVSETSRMLDAQKSTINRYKTIKQAPKNFQADQLKNIPQSAYALHRVFFWALRINEIYFILRRFGRQIFSSNHEHLHDQKFFSFVSNGQHYRDMLREIDENFFNAKKNGVLIATITRFLRMDTKQEISSKTIFDFVGFIFQSVVYIEGLLKLLNEFGYSWLSSEIAFRTSHNLPTENLLKLNDIVEGERIKDLKAKRLRAQMLAKPKVKPNAPSAIKSPQRQSSPSVIPARPSRGNSPVIFSGMNQKSAEQQPKTGAASQSDKPIESQSPFYLHRQSSTSSLQSSISTSSLNERKTAESPVATRRRSNSQPISFNAAAAALKNNGGSTPAKQEFFIRSPNGSIRRANSVTKRPPPMSVTSPLSNRRSVMGVVEEKKEQSPPKLEVRRTASQKFQQHLLEASRSGALYSKEKEVLTNVVFDPNNPSATNLRRQVKPAPQVSSPTKDETSPPIVTSPTPVVEEKPSQPVGDQRPTRAQITKLNTRRNSVVVQSDNFSRLSDLSRESMISTSSQSSPIAESVIVKKVRFTGVPEYTPAEDAPTSQTSRILKGFAVLKIPAVRNASFKRKDEAFKQEESQLFKEYLNHGESSALPNNTSIYAPGSQITSKFSRFKNRF